MRLKFSKFPVFFPVSREFGGERLAPDCILYHLQHPVKPVDGDYGYCNNYRVVGSCAAALRRDAKEKPPETERPSACATRLLY